MGLPRRAVLSLILTVAVSACGWGLTPQERNWQKAWAEGKQGRTPQWAGARRVLVPPPTIPDGIEAKWAKKYGIVGLTSKQVRKKFGKPIRVLTNESDDSKLFVYKGMCVLFYGGKCHATMPRSGNYEKYFLQPDL